MIFLFKYFKFLDRFFVINIAEWILFITQQIAATNDLQAVQAWLAEFEQSPQTLRCYRKEAERLLLWAISEKQKPLSSLTRDDLRHYQKFLADPQPVARWCGQRRPRNAINWRPFQGVLSAASIAHAITVINALFSYLVEAGYLSGNPLGLMRRKAAKALDKPQVTERFLEQPLWQAVLVSIQLSSSKVFINKNKFSFG